MDILPTLGINCDILLTDDEEWAQSSAYYFMPPTGKVYNWAFSFDRRGVGECVMYQYSSSGDAVDAILDAGWYFGWGSYSDISELEIGCVGFNFSAGYINEHTDACYCQYESVMYNVQLFKKFYQANKDIKFPFILAKHSSHYSKWDYEDAWDDGKWNNHNWKKTTTAVEICEYCGKKPATTYDLNGLGMCDDCYADIYLEPDDGKECTYCGEWITPSNKDTEYEDICAGCANWMRENMRPEELSIEWSTLKRRQPKKLLAQKL